MDRPPTSLRRNTSYFTRKSSKAIVFDDTSDAALSCEPMVSSLNDNKLDFKISFDESDDEDYTVNMDDPNITMEEYISLEEEKDLISFDESVDEDYTPEVSYFDDLDFFKDFENEFPAIVYNDALTFKSDLLTEPTISPRHIDEFDLKDETSLLECDEKEQNILYFNDLLPFNVIYPDDLESDTDNDNDKIDIEQPSGDMFVIPSPNVINVDTQGSNKLLETSINTEYPGEPSE
ncbi:hypothetical protein Tco_1246319 [Tanacetum coccineum]